MADHQPPHAKRIRQKNLLAAAPPPAFCTPEASKPTIIQRVVQRGRVVSLSGLNEGARVNVVQIDKQTFVVSARPSEEVLDLVLRIPAVPASPYGKVAEKLRGLSNAPVTDRVRGAYDPDLPSTPLISDAAALRIANVTRTRRVR